MEAVFNRRQSVASARPRSVSLLAYGEAFAYSEGVLCYVHDTSVRMLDVHRLSKHEKVVDLVGIEQMLPPQTELRSSTLNETRIISLRYSERVLVCVCESDFLEEAWLLIINLCLEDPKKDHDVGRNRPLSFRHRLSCKTKLFVRHNRSYLYYGTHSGLRHDGHHEWLVTGLSLETGEPITPKPFRLINFVGSDIGSTACFEIHDGFLFAVSNQTSFEAEEVDWTSYYDCIKIPLGETKPDLKARPIWQRQHGEGPINDSWTDLALQKDEQTNQLLIVECRKEWLGGGSANIRTYYIQQLDFNPEEELLQMLNFPANDPLTKTLDEHSKPHFSKPRKRIRKHYHHEYEHSRLDPRSPPPRDFILAKTKFRAYNPSAMSFVDLVCDPAPLPGSVRTRDRLRLRIASRKQKSPLVNDPDQPDQKLLRKPELDENDVPIEDSEIDFHPTEVVLWPLDDDPPEIYDVLCPSGRVGNIEAIADERSIVYMTDPPAGIPGRARAIVMINFDLAWGTMYKHLVLSRTGSAAPPKEMKLELPNSFSSPKAPKRTSSSSERASVPTRTSPPKRQKCDLGPSGGFTQQGGTGRGLMWEEDAMYLSIDRGYRLRYITSKEGSKARSDV